MLAIMFSCSHFKEDLDINKVPLSQLKADNIQTELPLVLINCDERAFKQMFDHDGEDIEIDARVSIRKNGQVSIHETEAEIEIKGNKSAGFALKSLGIKFEDSQDNQEQEVITIERKQNFHNTNKIKAIRLRNSGNDFSYAMLKDLCYSDLIVQAELDIDLMYGQAAHVFVNQRYYGLLNIRTESNAHGISRLYGVKKRDLTMVKINHPAELEFKSGDRARVDQLLKDIENKDYNALIRSFDIENVIDYFIFQTYIGNGDWPDNNVRFFAVKNGKFRFVAYDLDKAGERSIEKAPLYFIQESADNPIKDLFAVLYNNPNFKEQFDTRYKSLVQSNRLHYNSFNEIVDQRTLAIEKDLIYNIEQYGKPASMIEWYQNVGIIKEVFKKRAAAVKRHLGL